MRNNKDHKIIVFVLLISLMLLCALTIIVIYTKDNIKETNHYVVSNKTTNDDPETAIPSVTTDTSEADTSTDVPIDITSSGEETTGIPVNTTALAETTKAPETTEAPHSHHYYKRVVRATCTTDGYTLNVCDCGDKYTTEPTTKLGHSHTIWYVAKEATTSEEGIKESMCDRCGSSDVITEIIPKKTVESYIDPRIEVQNVFGKKKYKYGNCSVGNFRTWGNVFSISVLENGGLRVTYDNQNNETIEFDVLPPTAEGVLNSAIIRDDGSYDIQFVGAFS